MTAFDLAWNIVKADGTVTSGTPGTNNPMHSRPSGYESGGIFDPTKKKKKTGKKRPIGDKRRQQEGIKPDAPRLLAENKRKLGDVIQNSTTNLLYALGLFAKASSQPILDRLEENKKKSKETASPYTQYYGSKDNEQ